MNKQIKEGYTAWGKLGHFNDYVRKTSSTYLGKEQLHPITVTNMIDNGKYCIVTRGTSSSEKITNTIKIREKTITYNNYDTYIFDTNTITKKMYKFIGCANVDFINYKKLKRDGKKFGQHKELIHQILIEIEKKNYESANRMIEKQFYFPTSEEIKYKTIYKEATKYSSKFEREKYLIKNGIDLNKYSHRKPKTSLNDSSSDDEPNE